MPELECEESELKLKGDIEVRDIIENEGLEYAVLHYMDESSIDSTKTAKLWKVAREALQALSKHLKLED
jgi:hypothetical protein